MDSRELEDLRHDLKNVLTACRSGCVLIASELRDREPVALDYLEEMRTELDKGIVLLERLRASPRQPGPTGGRDAQAPPRDDTRER